MRFTAGQRVRCVDAAGRRRKLTQGKEYVVKYDCRAEDPEDLLWLVTDDRPGDSHEQFYARRFEPVAVAATLAPEGATPVTTETPAEINDVVEMLTRMGACMDARAYVRNMLFVGKTFRDCWNECDVLTHFEWFCSTEQNEGEPRYINGKTDVALRTANDWRNLYRFEEVMEYFLATMLKKRNLKPGPEGLRKLGLVTEQSVQNVQTNQTVQTPTTTLVQRIAALEAKVEAYEEPDLSDYATERYVDRAIKNLDASSLGIDTDDIAREAADHIDTSDIADAVLCNIDYDDIASKVAEDHADDIAEKVKEKLLEGQGEMGETFALLRQENEQLKARLTALEKFIGVGTP